ncbi:Hsp20/alpha crystallin family protein [Wenyingzhuangia sp. IMCC45574]
MSLIKFSNNYPSLFDRFFPYDINDANKHFSNNNVFSPLANIAEKEDGYSIELAIPGFTKEDFKIEIDNNRLTISSQKEFKNEENTNENYTVKEYSFQSFSRSFGLTDKVDQNQITASYENGILKLWVPKKEEAKPKPVQLIEVQ